MEDPYTVMKALGDKTRYRIVTLLLEHDYCVNALVKRLNATQSAVSQHLKILREAGLVIGEKRGYFTHYRMERGRLEKTIETLVELMNTKQKGSGSDCIRK
ncbi:MAG: ArsR/SmtB family transcription factor [Bacillota bacterium]